ncbi:type VI secretion system protein TssA [Rheinheimera maricola]|uniref:Type VI secretion system protein TssA n=1 Tax=Rheinheimera maricola TaxID=2793282 RepID=A0ABS7XD03_9GAMM|nr:type VI secretion system protein TssA [Rheinheimera maricola]MBZ9613411.1 type VI secretion system protein TssA [Rheinheimera maricola]
MEFQIPKLIAPLQGEKAGADPQSFADYDFLITEIAKLDGIQRVVLDWKRIADTCTALLTESTKDLKTANFLAFAWFQEYKFAGLKAGFELLECLVAGDLSEELYPRRAKRQEKARAAAFLWLAAKLEKHFNSYLLDEARDLDNAESAIEQFESLDKAIKKYLGDDAPLFIELKTVFNRFKLVIEQQKSIQIQKTSDQQPPAVEKFEEKAIESTSPKVELPKNVSDLDINKTLSSSSQAIRTVAQKMNEQHPYSPNVLYLNRTAKWILIQQLPGAGVLEQQPNEQVLNKLASLESNKNYAELFDAAEREFNNGAIFCLLLHRYVYNALVALNQELCAKVVLTTTTNFISRFPDIFDAKFRNGQPFIDDLTRTWLESKSTKDSSSSDEDSVDSALTPWLDASFKATSLLAEGKLQEAFKLFQSGLDQAKGVRDSLYWRYEMAALVAKTGHDDVVLLKLNHIYQLLNDTKVLIWQPELSIKVLKLMLTCHKKIQQKVKYDPPMLELVNMLKHDLIKLAPSEALALIESKT